MYKAKTKANDLSVAAFIEGLESQKKKDDAYALMAYFESVTGLESRMWGPSIIGYGSYHYVYASGHSGDAPLVGFSPRKKAISLYFAPGDDQRALLLPKLGKHTSGAACVYVKKFEDMDLEVLKQLILESMAYLKALYPS